MAVVTWNPADTAPNITFSNGNLTLTTSGGSFESCRATTNFTTPSKLYMEHVISSGALGDVLVGIGANSAGLNGQYTGQGTTSMGYQASSGQVLRGGSVIATIATGALGDTICQAWDMGNLNFWIRINGGNWNNSGTANPATNSGGITINGTIGGGPYPMATGGGSSVLTSNFGASAFSFSVPSGFGTPNNPSVVTNVSITGVQATFSVGNITPSLSSTLIGVQSITNVGNLTFSISPSPTLVSIQSNSQVGTFSIGISTSVALPNISANTQVGSFIFNRSNFLTGVVANSQVGTFFPTISPNAVFAFLNGIQGNAQVGSFTTSINAFLNGIQGNTQVGSFTTFINKEGLNMSDFECVSYPISNIDTFVSIQYSDDGGISWKNTISQSAGTTGEYGRNIQFRRLGQSRNRVYRVRTDNPRPLTGIFTEYEILGS